jgi:hypothetical protein
MDYMFHGGIHTRMQSISAELPRRLAKLPAATQRGPSLVRALATGLAQSFELNVQPLILS